MQKDKRKLVFSIMKALLVVISLGCMGIFTYFLLRLNIIPIKFLIVGFFALFFLFLLFFSGLYSKRKKVLKVISILFILLFSVSFLYGTKYLINTYNFFENVTQQEYETLRYSVLVLQDENYEKLDDLQGKSISYLENEYQEEVKNELRNISYTEVLNTEFGSVLDYLLERTTDAIVLEESYVAIAEEEIEDFSSKVKTIYSFDVRIKAHVENEEAKDITITMSPFILYISGIDQWGSVSSARGRSDVNQLVVVNPKTNHILLVNTPRDYYVQLAGTTGLKDKLTHAGIYGIDKSIETLENLYDIDITHYLRVNFDTVIQVVDVIGGIDINSDKAFRAYTNRNVYVEKGWNHFGGAQALAYARERYAYTTGDHHRGANQQQVITAILDKVTKSNVLISKYNSILNTLNGSFQTDMSMNEITSFIKYQLDKMPLWKIDSIAVTGSGSMDYTYSMGSKYKLYVMEPNMSSVETAKAKMNEVLNEG